MSRPPRTARLVGISALVQDLLDSRGTAEVNFGAACPSEHLMPTRRLQRTFASVCRRHPESLTRYVLPPGNIDLRRQIARRALDFGCSFSAQDILVTNGAMEALALCVRAVARPGDTIALESPTFFGFLQLLESAGIKALEIPTHPREGMSLEALQFALERTRIAAVLVMANAQNPLGFTMSEAHKQRLVALLEAHGVPLIEDDVYGDIHYADVRPPPAKAYDRTGNVMLCSTFTKTISPGLRLGWVAPGRWYERMQLAQFVSTLGVTEIVQRVMAEFLASGGYERQLRQMRRSFQAQTAQVAEAAAACFPAGTRISRPQGGFILWLELPEAVDSVVLFHQALRHKISFGPGVLFSSTDRYRNCLRIGCSDPWSPAIEQALARLGELAGRQLR